MKILLIKLQNPRGRVTMASYVCMEHVWILRVLVCASVTMGSEIIEISLTVQLTLHFV